MADQPATDGRRGELSKRIGSALVLGVLAIAAAVAGGLPFLVVWTIAALGVFWEWIRVTDARPRQPVLVVGGGAILGSALSLGFDMPAIGLACVLIGMGVVMAIPNRGRAWAGAGVIYAAAVLMPAVMLRADAAFGLVAILWLFAVVWTADITAYFSGRLIGGPRLAIRISPKKTWAGAVGGLVGGVLAGLAVLYAAGIAWRLMHVVVLIVVVIAAEAGDLFESAVKRRFAVKDAGTLIPGHGGLMDRLDGFLVAATVALGIGLVRAGPDASATGLLVW